MLLTAIAVIALMLPMFATAHAQEEPPSQPPIDAPAVDGALADAFGLSARLVAAPAQGVDVLEVPPTPTTSVQLPGDLPQSSTHVAQIGPLLSDPGSLGTAGAVELQASGQLGAGGFATSQAEVADVDLLVVDGDGLITANTIRAVSTTTCGPQTPEEAAERTRFIGLSIDGETLPTNIPPNTEIEIPGAANVTVNEVVPDTDGKGWTVRGLHIRVLDPLTNLVQSEVVVAEAHSSVGCAGEVQIPEPTTDLVADKTADVTSVARGGSFTYEVGVTNASEGACTLTSLIDTLPPGVTVTGLGGGLADTDTTVVDGDLVVPLDITLAPQEAFTGSIAVDVGDDATGPLYNDATFTSTACGSARTGLTARVDLDDDDGDRDDDGIGDEEDNCPTVPNADQSDVDGDGIGDVCDPVDGRDPVDSIDEGDDVEVVTGVSQEAFDQADTVVLARADEFADALTASVLAVEVGGPILLTDTGALRNDVAEEIERLGATRAYLAGGVAALSPAVDQQLTDMGVATTRLDGANRYDTARLVADEVVTLGGAVEAMLIARADDFADAMSAANQGAWGRHPILLTDTDSLNPTTAEALDTHLAPGSTVTIAGGTAAVSQPVEVQINTRGYLTQRHAGPERYATSVAFVDAARELGAAITPMWLASGERFQGALAATVAAHADGSVLLLVAPADLDASPATRDYLQANAEAIEGAYLVGSDIQLGLQDQVRAAIN